MNRAIWSRQRVHILVRGTIHWFINFLCALGAMQWNAGYWAIIQFQKPETPLSRELVNSFSLDHALAQWQTPALGMVHK